MAGEVEQFIEGMCTMEWISENVDKDENCTIVIDDMALQATTCLLYTSPSPRDRQKSRMPSSA